MFHVLWWELLTVTTLQKTNPPEIGCKLINCILEKTLVNNIETESPMEIR